MVHDSVVLRVEGGYDDPEHVDRVTTALYGDLREQGGFDVTRPVDAAGAVPGSKSGLGTAAAEIALAGTLSTATVTAVYKVIIAWLERTKARSVTWVQGDRQIVLTAVSRRDQQRAIDALTEQLAEAETVDGTAADGEVAQ